MKEQLLATACGVVKLEDNLYGSSALASGGCGHERITNAATLIAGEMRRLRNASLLWSRLGGE
eukprot:4086695-Alexandrium_andersonii.AAC.1